MAKTKSERTKVIRSNGHDVNPAKVAEYTAQLMNLGEREIVTTGTGDGIDVYDKNNNVAFSVFQENSQYSIVSQAITVPNGVVGFLEKRLFK